MSKVGLQNLIELINSNISEFYPDEEDSTCACEKCYYKWHSILFNLENPVDLKTLK